jgi:phosphotriesterase-related protein
MVDKHGSRYKLTGKAQTVLGTVSPESLGVTLPHEHLFCDFVTALSNYKPVEATEKGFYYQPVNLENLWWITYHPCSNQDNIRLYDESMAVKEAFYFKHAGGGTIVDLTSQSIGGDPLALARLSRATGLNIIMGAGYYLANTHPADMDSKTEKDICEEIVFEVTVGVGNTGIRAGIIGELGCSEPLADNEQKVLRAAARAQQHTGAPLNIHPGRKPEPDVRGCLEIIEILSKAGADISHTVISHIDRTLRGPEERRQLAETGCFLEYDIFGWEGYHTFSTIDLPNDNQRINEIIQLIDQGYLGQVLISQDVCWKHRLRSYGGHGYDHILRNVVPVMRLKGMSEEQIHTLLVDNPKRLLQFK